MALKYDDSAFFYVAITFLALYTIPASIFVVYRLVSFLLCKKAAVPRAVTAAQREQFEKAQREKRSLKRLFTIGFTVNLVLVIICSILLIMLVRAIESDGELAAYDPYAVLGLSPDAEESAIRKAFRRLSLQYHPDKNPDDPVAAQKFMDVATAHEALTDPVARENFQKWGNPHGRQSLEFGFGMPEAFNNPKWQKVLIACYLLAFVVALPTGVCIYNNWSKEYGEKNIMNKTYSWFFAHLKPDTNIKILPELLVTAAEFRSHNFALKNPAELADLEKKMKLGSLMPRPTLVPHLPKTKAYALYVGLYAYLNRIPMSPALLSDVHTVLSKSDALCDAMVDIILAQSRQTRSNVVPAMLSVLDFNQRLTQALWVKDSSLLQIPHFTELEVKHCGKGKSKCTSLQQYLNLDPMEMKGLKDFTDAQREEVLDFVRTVPNLDVQVELKVVGEDDIAERDLVTCTVTIVHKNLSEGQPVPPVHSPNFPFVKRERWWLFLLNDNRQLIGYQPIKTIQQTTVEEMKFLAPPSRKGGAKYNFEVLVKSGSYVELDHRVPLRFSVLPQRPELEAHEDDINLGGDEPSLWSAFENQDEDTDSDEESGDEEDQDEAKVEEIAEVPEPEEDDGLTPAERKRRAKRQALRLRKAASAQGAEAAGDAPAGDEDGDDGEEKDAEDKDL